MHAVEDYLRNLREIHATGGGVPETSYYGSLEALLNSAGRMLKPRVRCVINLANSGAGLPDGGFFTREQLNDSPDTLILKGQKPSRGVMEVKSPSDDVVAIANSKQVKDQYWPAYGQVLVTNLRSFLLVGSDPSGAFAIVERFDLAESEVSFWARVSDPRTFANAIGDPLMEFLARLLLRPSPLRDPRDVAWFLASYARDAKARVDVAPETLLADVRVALQDALGIEFTGDRGHHFFRATLVQTLFYGVFAAWVLWAREPSRASGDRFDWKLAQWTLHVPMITALYTQLNSPARLGALGVVDLLEWTGDTLNRVDRAEFFNRFEEGKAVQYFYEPFLEAYDPELRKQLGVWYTPPEVVQYIVARVDHVLRTELAIQDGLADERVIVLDPATGTGSFLLEVLSTIERTLRSKSDDALVGQDLKRAARERVIGFELLPAALVVAHLQLGLMLRRQGAPLAGDERAAVFLTNSLTGWTDVGGDVPRALFPEMEEERDLAQEVKQDKHVIVVLGNPPYYAFAGTATREEGDLMEPYKTGLREKWGMRKYNLDDLYVRFIRVAERRIAEQSGEGVIALITNFSYVDEASYVVMRERLVNEFDAIWIDSLNGDTRSTGKKTPEGLPDPSIFSTPSNPAGITVGTAVGLMVKRSQGDEPAVVRHRQFWGATKRADLLESLESKDIDAEYEIATPAEWNRYSFVPSTANLDYQSWPKLTELARQFHQGLSEDRRKALVDIDRVRLADRMKIYFDSSVSWSDLAAAGGPLTRDYVDFDAKSMRHRLLGKEAETFADRRIVQFLARPYDLQWCYYLPIQGFWRRPRPEYAAQVRDGNAFLITRFKASGPNEGLVTGWTEALTDYHAMMTSAVLIPMLIFPVEADHRQLGAFGDDDPKPNVSDDVGEFLERVAGPRTAAEQAGLIWHHALAITTSPAYLGDNAEAVLLDYPRVPLPDSTEILEQSAELGRRVATLVDVGQDVQGITSGTVQRWAQQIAVLTKDDGSIDPSVDLLLESGWGYIQGENKVMPGPGRVVERPFSDTELAAVGEAAEDRGLLLEDALRLLGGSTIDVYLNEHTCWANVPRNVWDHSVTRVQVLKKWLAYREGDVLRRPLTPAEVRLFGATARRVAELLLLGPTLDENYRVAAGAHAYVARGNNVAQN